MFVLVVLLCVPLSWLGYNLRWMQARETGYRRLRLLSQGGFMAAPAVAAPWPLRLLGATNIDTRDWRIRLDESDPELNRLRELFPELRLIPIKRQSHDNP